MNPVFETERLVARRWRNDDLDTMVEIYATEEHARFVGGKKERWEAWRILALHEGHIALHGYSLFALEEKASGNMVGWAGPWFPDGFPEPEIGYALAPSAIGKGFAKEAVIGNLKYIYEKLGWKTAMSLIDPENAASEAVARSVGATIESEPTEFCGFVARIWRHLSPEQFAERFA